MKRIPYDIDLRKFKSGSVYFFRGDYWCTGYPYDLPSIPINQHSTQETLDAYAKTIEGRLYGNCIKVYQDEEDPCWVFPKQAHSNVKLPKGIDMAGANGDRPRINFQGKKTMATTWLWERKNKTEVPKATELSHLCGNGNCLNHYHLHPESRLENRSRDRCFVNCQHKPKCIGNHKIQ